MYAAIEAGQFVAQCAGAGPDILHHGPVGLALVGGVAADVAQVVGGDGRAAVAGRRAPSYGERARTWSHRADGRSVGESLGDLGQNEEAVAPGAIRIGAAYTLFRILLQVGNNLLRRVARKPLAHQGRHAGHVGRCLTGPAERARSRRFPASRSDYVWLHPPVRRRATAAVTLNTVDVAPVCRPHRQHPWVGALRGVYDAADPGVILKPNTTFNH